MAIQKISVFLLFILLSFTIRAFDLTQVNMNYHYDLEGELFIQARLIRNNEDLQLLLQVKGDSLHQFKVDLLAQFGYDAVRHDTVNVAIDTLYMVPDEIFLKFPLGNPQGDLLVVSIHNQSENAYWFKDLKIDRNIWYPNFYPIRERGYPILSNYITSESVTFSAAGAYHVSQYQAAFGPADPPRGSMKPLAPNLPMESAYFFNDKLTGLENYHFYLVQKDTMDGGGVTLLHCPSYYPEYKKLEELIDPLTYITTPTELKNLKGNMNKKAFEQFWLGTYGTKFRAKSAIKFYYNRLEQANILFTDYKQGWKTDRGIVYTIYGKPDEVYRSKRTEVWYYNDGIEFEFIRISTLFTSDMYVLKREKAYEKYWYQQVGRIRKG